MRSVLVMLVLVSHGLAFDGFGNDPLEIFSGGTIPLGSMAVHGFFVISGCLAT